MECRDGRVEHRRVRDRLAEGADAAAGAGVRVGQREGVEEDRRDAGAELLLRPAALQEVARRERHAVHAGEHAHQGAAGEPEADPRRGHREPVGAAREDRGRLPGGREGDGPGGVRRAAEQRADGHHRARRRRRHGDAEEAGEAVRLQAGRRPGHAEGQDLAAGAHGLHRRVRRARRTERAGTGAAGIGLQARTRRRRRGVPEGVCAGK